MKYPLSIFLFLPFIALAESDSLFLKVHFLYGSKPLRKHKKTESKYFGGIHGGHVTIEVEGKDYGLLPAGRFHIFSHKKKRNSVYGWQQTNGASGVVPGYKFAVFFIPVTPEQYDKAKEILENYAAQTPYDYAFFGMRCASAANDVLGQLNILKKRSRFGYVATSFYPKKLRKKLFKLAAKHNYKVLKQAGRVTRKWEKG